MEDVSSIQLLDGEVAIIPTDTVYGLVAKAGDEAGVAKLYELKSRENKPGTLLAANIDQLVELGLKRRYLTAVEQYWPAAVSIIIPCSDPKLKYLHQGKMSLAVRIPDEKNIQKALINSGPLLSSSANLPGQQPAENIEQAKDYFGKKVDKYIDGGNLSNRQPSTIIRIVDDAVDVIRAGAVKISE